MTKKYHQEHPTISFRCRNIEEYERIKNMVECSGKSESTFIRELLLGAEEKESQSFNNGYALGFNKIALRCPHCPKSMIIDCINDPTAANKICEAFKDFAHSECIENKRKQEEAEQQRIL